MKNWKTTLCGALMAVGAFLASQEQPMLHVVGLAITVVSPLLLGAVSKDHNVTGGTKNV